MILQLIYFLRNSFDPCSPFLEMQVMVMIQKLLQALIGQNFIAMLASVNGILKLQVQN